MLVRKYIHALNGLARSLGALAMKWRGQFPKFKVDQYPERSHCC